MRILTYGTFDLFHYGHESVLRRARGLGSSLFVGVSSDKFNNFKGKVSYDVLHDRINNVNASGFADYVFEEHSFEQKKLDISKYDIDLFVIGDDWEGKFDWLKEYCDVKYLARTPNISTTMLKEHMNWTGGAKYGG